MACLPDLLQELDCLAAEAGKARVQHESDQRDDGVHVGPGERQGRRWTEASLGGGPACGQHAAPAQGLPSAPAMVLCLAKEGIDLSLLTSSPHFLPNKVLS